MDFEHDIVAGILARDSLVFNVNNSVGKELVGYVGKGQFHIGARAQDKVRVVSLTVVRHHHLHSIIVAQVWVCAPNLGLFKHALAI